MLIITYVILFKIIQASIDTDVSMLAYAAGLCDYSCNTERNNSNSIFSIFFRSKCCRLLHNCVSVGSAHWLGKAAAPVFVPVITGNMAHQAADCAAVIPDRF
jgi:hypothetical protein